MAKAKKVAPKKVAPKEQVKKALYGKGQAVVVLVKKEWFDGKIITADDLKKKASVDIGNEEVDKVVVAYNDILLPKVWESKYGGGAKEDANIAEEINDDDFNIADIVDDDLGSEATLEEEDLIVEDELKVDDDLVVDDELAVEDDGLGTVEDDSLGTVEDDSKNEVVIEESVSDAWYSIGDDDDAEFDDSNENQTFRLWMPNGAKKIITILTSKPFTFKEHDYKKNNSWKNWVTCIARGNEACPFCEGGNRNKTKKAFYIIDHSEYTSKDDKKVKNQLRLMVMTKNSYEKLKLVANLYFDGAEPNYKGLRVIANRTMDEKAPGTGDVFVVKDRVTIKKTKANEKFIKTMEDVIKEFTPLTREKLSNKVHFMEDSE